VTGNLVADLAISFAGILVLVGISYFLGGLRSKVVTADAAIERLSFDEPDFEPGFIMVGADGKSAAVVSSNSSETALVFAVGDGFATRRFRHGAISLEKHGDRIEFRLNELSRRAVLLQAPDSKSAEEWLLRLAGPRL
jgi:hypothetical protein